MSGKSSFGVLKSPDSRAIAISSSEICFINLLKETPSSFVSVRIGFRLYPKPQIP
jgi:hypothetical protein